MISPEEKSSSTNLTRQVSCFLNGLLTVLARLLNGQSIPLGRLHPQSFNYFNDFAFSNSSSLLKTYPCKIPPSPYLKPGNLEHTKIKALSGILGNIAIAIIFSFFSHNIIAQAAIAANLLIAFSSLSDIEAFITVAADYLYCGNFGAIALRKPEDGQKLLPERILNIVLQMGHETEIRGEQAGGGFVIGRESDKPAQKGILKSIPSKTPSDISSTELCASDNGIAESYSHDEKLFYGFTNYSRNVVSIGTTGLSTGDRNNH